MSFNLRKVAVIGTGHVGSNVAFALATQGIADEIHMVDIDRKKSMAQAMDINDAVSYLPHHVRAISSTIEQCGSCDVMIISAGPVSPVTSERMDSLKSSIKVIDDIIPRIKKSGFSGIIVSITNPADVIAFYLQKKLPYPKEKIISTGTSLDSSRLKRIISEHLNVGRHTVNAYCMGEHGNTAMVPWSQVNIAGKPIDEILCQMPERFPYFDKNEVVEKMKYGGYEVITGKGSTEFGIASAACEIIRAIFHDEKKLLPISVLLFGQYSVYDTFASVPAILGRDGVEAVIEVDMTKEESYLFKKSCEFIKENIKKIISV